MTAGVDTIGRLFDGRYRFQLTCFQRAYAWQAPQVARLLTNLRERMEMQGPKRRYSLGRLMLARPAGSVDTELVDGHQRLVTLTILIAVLRDLERDPTRANALHRLIADDTLPPHDPRCHRLTVQALSAPLFEHLVQRRGATESEPDGARNTLSESERNIVDNRDLIRSEFMGPDVSEAFRREFVEFLLKCCSVATLTMEDHEEAWNFIATEQETGMRFSLADEAKATLLSAMDKSDRPAGARLWEAAEALLNPTDTYRLLSHIGAIEWRARAHHGRRIELELIRKKSIETRGLQFLCDQFVPFAQMLHDIRHGKIGADDNDRAAIAQRIEFLSWIDRDCHPDNWVRAVLKWIQVRGRTAPDTYEFMFGLERLVWLMQIAAVDPGVQETRLLDLLSEIDSSAAPEEFSRLRIEPKLREAAIKRLAGKNFGALNSISPHVLRKLSILSGSDPGPKKQNEATFEHVLPKGTRIHPSWRRAFPKPEFASDYCQRLGNIVLLSGEDNNRADSMSWEDKRVYFARSQFVLAREACVETEWTPATIDRRTKMLINRLLKDWKLEPIETLP